MSNFKYLNKMQKYQMHKRPVLESVSFFKMLTLNFITVTKCFKVFPHFYGCLYLKYPNKTVQAIVGKVRKVLPRASSSIVPSHVKCLFPGSSWCSQLGISAFESMALSPLHSATWPPSPKHYSCKKVVHARCDSFWEFIHLTNSY